MRTPSFPQTYAEDTSLKFQLLRARGRRVMRGATVWYVFELPASEVIVRTLVFECNALVRRVRAYPMNWHELDDDALFALSEGL